MINDSRRNPEIISSVSIEIFGKKNSFAVTASCQNCKNINRCLQILKIKKSKEALSNSGICIDYKTDEEKIIKDKLLQLASFIGKELDKKVKEKYYGKIY